MKDIYHIYEDPFVLAAPPVQDIYHIYKDPVVFGPLLLTILLRLEVVSGTDSSLRTPASAYPRELNLQPSGHEARAADCFGAIGSGLGDRQHPDLLWQRSSHDTLRKIYSIYIRMQSSWGRLCKIYSIYKRTYERYISYI